MCVYRRAVSFFNGSIGAAVAGCGLDVAFALMTVALAMLRTEAVMLENVDDWETRQSRTKGIRGSSGRSGWRRARWGAGVGSWQGDMAARKVSRGRRPCCALIGPLPSPSITHLRQSCTTRLQSCGPVPRMRHGLFIHIHDPL